MDEPVTNPNQFREDLSILIAATTHYSSIMRALAADPEGTAILARLIVKDEALRATSLISASIGAKPVVDASNRLLAQVGKDNFNELLHRMLNSKEKV